MVGFCGVIELEPSLFHTIRADQCLPNIMRKQDSNRFPNQILPSYAQACQ